MWLFPTVSLTRITGGDFSDDYIVVGSLGDDAAGMISLLLERDRDCQCSEFWGHFASLVKQRGTGACILFVPIFTLAQIWTPRLFRLRLISSGGLRKLSHSSC